MKTNTTPSEIEAIKDALSKLHVSLYSCKSDDPKRDAQRNLLGRTHYVDDDTLRCYHSRILSAQSMYDGLLFRIVCSDALDMHNTKRGFRAVVFDVFGTVIFRPSMEQASPTKQAAANACEKESIDLVAYYQGVLKDRLAKTERESESIKTALAKVLH